jgi:hypothetical protein
MYGVGRAKVPVGTSTVKSGSTVRAASYSNRVLPTEESPTSTRNRPEPTGWGLARPLTFLAALMTLHLVAGGFASRDKGLTRGKP